MPCATQNEIGLKNAEQIVSNGVKYYIEVSNMPTTNEALESPERERFGYCSKQSGKRWRRCRFRFRNEPKQHALCLWSKREVDAKLKEMIWLTSTTIPEMLLRNMLGYNLFGGCKHCWI